MDSLLARSKLHMHHRSHWMAKIILPLATLSLCLWRGLRPMGRASSFLWRPHVGGFWAQGLQGWSVAKQLYSGQPQTQSARWARLEPRTLCAAGDAAGGQPESEGSRCLHLCFCVKMNFFPSICKQDLPTQEIIMDVLTCCRCVLYTWKHGVFLAPGWCMVMQMQNSILDCQTSCCLNSVPAWVHLLVKWL